MLQLRFFIVLNILILVMARNSMRGDFSSLPKILRTTRMINGIAAGSYPWMALIGYKNVSYHTNSFWFGCGGSVITAKHVLSAAHCFTDRDKNRVLFVRLGAIYKYTDADGDAIQDINVMSVNIHKNYTRQPKGLIVNDIAILTLEQNIKFSRSVTAIALPINKKIRNFELKPGLNVIIAGWGRTEFQGGRSEIMLELSMSLLDNVSCSNGFRNNGTVDSEKQICIENSSSGPCSGDSGGPMMLLIDGVYYIFGILSMVQLKCEFGPTILTKIPYYVDWIESSLK